MTRVAKCAQKMQDLKEAGERREAHCQNMLHYQSNTNKALMAENATLRTDLNKAVAELEEANTKIQELEAQFKRDSELLERMAQEEAAADSQEG